MLSQLLKKYDKYLRHKKTLDGSTYIYRQSPFSHATYNVLALENLYVGSAKWVLRKIASMDSTRHDFIVSSINNNQKIRKTKTDKRITEEIADFVNNGGMTFNK
jgi:hypothetical protein